MSGSVTVPSGTSTPISQPYSNTFNSALAKSIADALAAASNSGNLFIQTVTGSGTGTVTPPPNTSSLTGELIIEPGSTGSFSVPSGSNYAYVIDDSAGPDTIFGSAGLSIMGGTGIHTIVDPSVITLSDNAIGNVLLTNAGDTVAAGNGAATVSATAANEVVLGGGGALLVNLSGQNDKVVGATGALTATASGNGDTILGGAGAASVTLTGSNALVVGSVAGLSVLDNGTADTIDAGQSLTSITAPGGAFVRGGSGPLNFVGGSGPSTIVGATGTSSVFGGSGSTSVVGGAGGAMTYVNTTGGGLFYVGGAGNETINASLSKGSATLYGGTDSTGQNLLIGGPNSDFINAGPGLDTMVGGGGANWFYVFKAAVGPGANEVISDFSAIDNLALVGYGADAGANAIAGATTTNGSTTITLADNTRITFTGVTDPAALNGHVGSF